MNRNLDPGVQQPTGGLKGGRGAGGNDSEAHTFPQNVCLKHTFRSNSEKIIMLVSRKIENRILKW